MWILNLALVITQIRGQFPVVNDCKKAHDNALEKQQFVGSPAFPRRSMATSNCKFTWVPIHNLWSISYGRLQTEILKNWMMSGENGLNRKI